MQMNTTDLAHRAADLGHAASSLATQVVDTITEHGASALDTAGRMAGDVGEVLVDAVDRVGRALPALPGTAKRRFPLVPIGAVAVVVVALVMMRRKRRARQSVGTAAGQAARPVEHAAANGSSRSLAKERAAGLA